MPGRLIYLILVTIGEGLAYNSTLVDFAMCKSAVPAMDPEMSKKFVGHVYGYRKGGALLVRGNVTVMSAMSGLARFRGGVKRRGKPFNFSVDIRGLTCRNVIVRGVYVAGGLAFDPATCVVQAGTYVFHSVDVTQLERLMNALPVRERGLNVWYLGFYTKHGTLLCFDIRINIA